MRYVGGGNYLGVPVLLVALWAALRAFRKGDAVFTLSGKKAALVLERADHGLSAAWLLADSRHFTGGLMRCLISLRFVTRLSFSSR